MFIYYPIKIVFTVRRVYKKCYIIKIKSFVYYCTNERNLPYDYTICKTKDMSEKNSKNFSGFGGKSGQWSSLFVR